MSGPIARELSDVVDAAGDPARVERGAVYAAKGAVRQLGIAAGAARAEVRGSRAAPYEVVIGARPASDALVERLADELTPLEVRLLAAGATVPSVPEAIVRTSMTPGPHDLAWSCTCPDWDEPCKHAVAALLDLAGDLDRDPRLVLQWRSVPIDRLLEAAGVDPVDAVEALRGLLGETARRPAPPPPRRGPDPFLDGPALDAGSVDAGALDDLVPDALAPVGSPFAGVRLDVDGLAVGPMLVEMLDVIARALERR